MSGNSAQPWLWSLLPNWIAGKHKRGEPAVPQLALKPEPKPATQPERREWPRSDGPALVLAPLPEALSQAMPMRERYPLVERAMLARYGVRVRKWRSSTSGVAWSVLYKDGKTSRLIESPRPRGPMSAAVFLHEIGHHAIGLGRFKPRCLEEFYAWAFSLHQMRELGLPITDRVRKRAGEALVYAVDKAARRKLKRIPVVLVEMIEASRAGDLERIESLLVEAGARLCAPAANPTPA